MVQNKYIKKSQCPSWFYCQPVQTEKGKWVELRSISTAAQLVRFSIYSLRKKQSSCWLGRCRYYFFWQATLSGWKVVINTLTQSADRAIIRLTPCVILTVSNPPLTCQWEIPARRKTLQTYPEFSGKTPPAARFFRGGEISRWPIKVEWNERTYFKLQFHRIIIIKKS